MKLLVIADLDHYYVEDPPDLHKADILLACGDTCDRIIIDVARESSCTTMMAVKGNTETSLHFCKPIIDLHRHVHEVGGIRFGGLKGALGSNACSHFLHSQDDVAKMLSAFPPVDVLICHNSPRHVHDKKDRMHHGFDALNDYIHRVQPRFVFHGHMHKNEETVVGKTRVVGVYGWRLIEM